MSTQLFFKKMSVFVVGIFLLSSSGAHAVNSLWTGDTSSDMTDVINNWDLPAYPTLNTGTFVGDAATITNPILNSYFYADALNFQSAGWTIGGSGTLRLNSAGGWGLRADAVNSGTININPAIELAGAQTWGIAGNDTATSVMNVRGNVSGTYNLTIGGRGGQVNFYGDNSAFSGTLTLNSYSVLGISSASAVGTGRINVNNGTLMNISGSTLTLANDFDVVATLSYNTAPARQVAVHGGVIYNATTILNGSVTANTVNSQFSINSGTLVITGAISGTGKTGRGNYNQSGALVLAGDNRAFSGTMEFNQGWPDALISGTPNTAGAFSANYINNQYAFGSSQVVKFLGSAIVLGNSSGAALKIATSNSLQFSYSTQFVGPYDLDLGDGPVELVNGHTFNISKATLSMGTLLTTNYNLTKNGAGNLIFNGNAAIGTGKVIQINNGGLLAVRGTLTNDGSIQLNDGQLGTHGTLTMTNLFSGGNGTMAGLAAFGGDLIYNAGGTGASQAWGNNNQMFMGGGNRILALGHELADGTVDIQNGIALGSSARTVQVVSGSGAAKIDARLSGTVSGFAAGSLTKTGNGVLELSGNNTYQGDTAVTAGTLLVSGSTGGQGAFTVSANATLGGHGVIGTNNQNVNVSGVLDVSGGGVLDDLGTLTLNLGTGTLDLSAAEGLGFILGADGDSDQIKLLGSTKFLWNNALTLGDFNFTLGSGFTGDGTYELIVSAGTLLPSFTDLTGLIGGGAYDATLSLLNSNALVLTVTNIPEPSTLLLLLSGGALLIMLRRKR